MTRNDVANANSIARCLLALAAGMLCSLVHAQVVTPSGATQPANRPRLAEPIWFAIPQWSGDELSSDPRGRVTYRLRDLNVEFLVRRHDLQRHVGKDESPFDPADYPNVVVAGKVSTRCHLVMVGPRALLTAAHCLEKGSVFSVRVSDTTRVDATCYAMDKTLPRTCETDGCPAAHDLALCRADDNLPLTPGGYESVDTSKRPEGEVVTVRIPAVGHCSGQEGLYGKTSVKAVWPPGDRSTPLRTHFAVTKENVPLCDGDTGTGWLLDAGPRRLVAVQSRGDRFDPSMGAVLGSEAVQKWLETEAARLGVAVCGLSPDAGPCR